MSSGDFVFSGSRPRLEAWDIAAAIESHQCGHIVGLKPEAPSDSAAESEISSPGQVGTHHPAKCVRFATAPAAAEGGTEIRHYSKGVDCVTLVDGSTPMVACWAAQLFEARQAHAFKFQAMSGCFSSLGSGGTHDFLTYFLDRSLHSPIDAAMLASAAVCALNTTADMAVQLATPLQKASRLSLVLPLPTASLYATARFALLHSGSEMSQPLQSKFDVADLFTARVKAGAQFLSLPARMQLKRQGGAKRTREQSLTSSAVQDVGSQSGYPQQTSTGATFPLCRSSAKKIAKFLRSDGGTQALRQMVAGSRNPPSTRLSKEELLSARSDLPVTLVVDICCSQPWKVRPNEQASAASNDEFGCTGQKAGTSEADWILLDCLRFSKIFPRILRGDRFVAWQPNLAVMNTRSASSSNPVSLPAKLPTSLLKVVVNKLRGSRQIGASASVELSTIQLAGMWLQCCGGVWNSVSRSNAAHAKWWAEKVCELAGQPGHEGFLNIRLSAKTCTELTNPARSSGTVLVRFAVERTAKSCLAAAQSRASSKTAILPTAHLQYAARRAFLALLALEHVAFEAINC